MEPRVQGCLVSAVILVALHFAHVSPANACTPPDCVSGEFVPQNGAEIPANTRALYWLSPGLFRDESEPDGGDLQLVRVDGCRRQEIAVTLSEANFSADSDVEDAYLVRPEEGFERGATYRLEERVGCAVDDPSVEPAVTTFEIGAPQELPESLGVLGADCHERGELRVATSSGSCSTEIDADQVAFETALSEEALPWADLFLYATKVDGERWSPRASLASAPPPGAAWTGRGSTLVYATCHTDDEGADEGLPEGTHSVRTTATLPGVEQSWTAGPVDVELSCDRESRSACFTPAPPPDAGVSTPDAGTAAELDCAAERPSGCRSSGGGGPLLPGVLLVCAVLSLGVAGSRLVSLLWNG